MVVRDFVALSMRPHFSPMKPRDLAAWYLLQSREVFPYGSARFGCAMCDLLALFTQTHFSPMKRHDFAVCILLPAAVGFFWLFFSAPWSFERL